MRRGADADKVGRAALHDLDEDGDGAARVVHRHRHRAQRHLGPSRVVDVLPTDFTSSVIIPNVHFKRLVSVFSVSCQIIMALNTIQVLILNNN